MKTKLAWRYLNIGTREYLGFRIYRGTIPLNPSALPPPLATVGPHVETYTDVTPDRIYFYMVEGFTDTISWFSGSIEVVPGFYMKWDVADELEDSGYIEIGEGRLLQEKSNAR